MFMLMHAEHEGVTIYITDNEHEHDNANTNGLPKETMKKVEELLQNGMANSEIIRTIRRLGLTQITDVQLRNYKSRLNKQ